MPDFATFVFDQLPPAPRRVVEIGCGNKGGLVEQLVERGYDAIGVDPDAPAGERFVQTEFQTLDGEWDAVVAANVLHHVNPLAESLDRLARLAPLLLVDEFAANRIDAAARDWYEAQHRMLRASGAEPHGPPSLEEWWDRHRDLHWDELLLGPLRARYDEVVLERVPWLHHWLGGPSSEALEESLVAAGAFPAIGWHWAGRRARTA